MRKNETWQIDKNENVHRDYNKYQREQSKTGIDKTKVFFDVGNASILDDGFCCSHSHYFRLYANSDPIHYISLYFGQIANYIVQVIFDQNTSSICSYET